MIDVRICARCGFRDMAVDPTLQQVELTLLRETARAMAQRPIHYALTESETANYYKTQLAATKARLGEVEKENAALQRCVSLLPQKPCCSELCVAYEYCSTVRPFPADCKAGLLGYLRCEAGSAPTNGEAATNGNT